MLSSGLNGLIRPNPQIGTHHNFILSHIIQHQPFMAANYSTSNNNNNNPHDDLTNKNDNIPEIGTTRDPNLDEIAYKKSERAKQAAKVNLAAKLSPRDTTNKGGGLKEIMRLLSLARHEVKPLMLAVFFLIVSAGVMLTLPLTIGKILDVANNTEEEEKRVFGLPLATFYTAVASLFVVGAGANFGRVVLLRVIGERLVARLRVLLFKRTISQDAEFFDANRVGDLISRLSSDTSIVAKSLTQNVSDGLRSTITASFGLVMMCYVSLKLTSMILLIIPPVFLGSVIYGKRVRQLSRDLQAAVGSLTKVSEERLSSIRTAQSFAGEIQEINRYSTKIRDVFTIGKREAIAAASYFASTGLAGNLTILSLLAIGSQMVASGEMTLGALTSFTMYTGYAGSAAFGISTFYSELMKGVGAASRLFELMDREPSIKPTVGEKIVNARSTITFDKVQFSYPTRPAVTIFKDLSFSIPAGSNVCIVGPSGGGKSTISSLILRFYDPTSGSIRIGGQDLKNVNVKNLRRHIGVVSQEPVLFSGTIAENIAYGMPKATRYQIYEAARRANCDFISDFPDGLDTPVGARGTQLSGGQKQRIAIARALIKQPSILILDEATSALDSESEAAVNEALARLMTENSTTISIAHRLSTIKRSDSLVVLGTDGRVAEQGSFNELIAQPDSALSKLLKAQAEDVLAVSETSAGDAAVTETVTQDDVAAHGGRSEGILTDAELGEDMSNSVVEELAQEELEELEDEQEQRDLRGDKEKL
jgi:putative ABC transport system ATP-binding protein